MDLGLYNTKYAARRAFSFLLPYLQRIDPNLVSWSLLPIGALTALCYYLAAQGSRALFLVGSVLILTRMFLGTIDGMLAEAFNKSTPQGAVINRLTPELCDVLLLLTLTLAMPQWKMAGIFALASAWLTTFSGLVGATAGRSTQSVGPVGQTDRLAALILFSILQFFAPNWDCILLFLWWSVAGGAVTILLRTKRNLK